MNAYIKYTTKHGHIVSTVEKVLPTYYCNICNTELVLYNGNTLHHPSHKYINSFFKKTKEKLTCTNAGYSFKLPTVKLKLI